MSMDTVAEHNTVEAVAEGREAEAERQGGACMNTGCGWLWCVRDRNGGMLLIENTHKEIQYS